MEKLSHTCPATLASKPPKTRFESEALPLSLPVWPELCPSTLLLSQRHLWRAYCVRCGRNAAPRERACGCRLALQRACAHAWEGAGDSGCTRVFGCPAIPLTPLQPCPWSLGTSGAQEEGVGWERGGTNNEGKEQGGAAKGNPPAPSPDGASACVCNGSAGSLACHPWGRGVTRAPCHSESSGSLEVIASHYEPLNICKAVGHWHTHPRGCLPHCPED